MAATEARPAKPTMPSNGYATALGAQREGPRVLGARGDTACRTSTRTNGGAQARPACKRSVSAHRAGPVAVSATGALPRRRINRGRAGPVSAPADPLPSPNRACAGAWGEIRVRAEHEDHEGNADPTQGDASPAAVRLHAERHGTCSARAGEPRSTPEWACFTTCPEATLTCAAREVTLYLAVPFHAPHRSLSLLLAPCSPIRSPVRHRCSAASGSGPRTGRTEVRLRVRDQFVPWPHGGRATDTWTLSSG
jgi:hypothetical protein